MTITIKTYTITAGDNSTDLGVVGHADTFLGAKRIGRRVVRMTLPNGAGIYTIHNRHVPGKWYREERSIKTGFRWAAFGS